MRDFLRTFGVVFAVVALAWACGGGSSTTGRDGGGDGAVMGHRDGSSADGATGETGAEGGRSGPDDRYCGPGDTPAFGGGHDDVAALPQACVYTALSGSPSGHCAGGSCAKTVCPSGCDFADVASAVAAAQCGWTIRIQAEDAKGAQRVYAADDIQVTQSCPKDDWLILESDRVDDPGFPAEGERITPCWAGRPTLEGRAYPCPAGGAGVYVPKLIAGSTNKPAFQIDGASHVRFIGLEIGSTAGKVNDSALVYAGSAANGGDHIILDRVILHGGDDPKGQNASDVSDGVSFADTTYGALVDSFLYDFVCVGVCSDSHAVTLGGNGLRPEGPFKVEGDWLEASGENVFSGGGGSGGDTGCCTVPKDIEIRRNHAWKPMFWMVSQACPNDGGSHPGCVCKPNSRGKMACSIPNPTYYGTKVVVKNLTEFKTAERVLLEGNVFENNWGGQSDQFGTALVLDPRNQSRKDHGQATSDGSGTLTAAAGSTFTSDVTGSTCAVPGHCVVSIAGATYAAQSYVDATHIVVSPAPPVLTTPSAFDQCRPGGNPNGTLLDLTLRYNVVRHAARGGTASTEKSTLCHDVSKDTARFSVHDNVWDDIDGLHYNLESTACCAWSSGFQISNANDAPGTFTHLISIFHNTFMTRIPEWNSGTEGAVHVTNTCGAACTLLLDNIQVRDNVGAGGMTDNNSKAIDACLTAKKNRPAASLLDCVSGSSGPSAWCFTNNVLATGTVPASGGNPAYPDAATNLPWPTSSPSCPASVTKVVNYNPTDYGAIDFVDLKDANGGDYHLSQKSPYRGKASDGKDPGADIDLVDSATAGVP